MTQNSSLPAPGAAPGWGELLSGTNLLRSLALSGGVTLHAVNLYIATTILPSVVRDIGGLDYYAWSTTVYVVASIVGAAVSARLLVRVGPRAAYPMAALVFALGSLLCATAPTMPMLLLGRFVQGLGGGMLVALPYAMVRIVFEPRLWSRGMAMISGMWGISSLLGPALGGVFAELGMWRAAFWSLIPIIALLSLAAVLVLPRRSDDSVPAPLPGPQLLWLTVAVLAASWASVAHHLHWSFAGVGIAGLLLALMLHTERRSRQRLFPRGSFQLSSPLGPLYAMSALLAVTVTCTEIFVPLFLQEMHGRSPLQAGYIAAMMSVGWTLAALTTSGFQHRRLTRALRAAPLLSLASMAGLALTMPAGDGSWIALVPVCLALVIGGAGVGTAYPHLGARVLQVAPADEEDVAAASIMTVQLCATAFGAALAGLVVNLTGQPEAGQGLADVAGAARWLFAIFMAAPLACLALMWPRAPQLGEAA